MHIIIDGYNLIRQSDFLRSHEKQSLEAGRRALLLRLAKYKREKGHKITVVFDGWDKGPVMEERDRQENISIIYSCRGEKADDVIKRLAASSSEEIVIISSDREIASYVARQGKIVLSSPEFEMLMFKAINEFPVNYLAVDKDDVDSTHHLSKKGPAKRLSRARRQAQIKIRKL
jgi:predicted RNA-binding protein with PIN domain